jgi:hypothetical protein
MIKLITTSLGLSIDVETDLTIFFVYKFEIDVAVFFVIDQGSMYFILRLAAQLVCGPGVLIDV